MKSFDNYNPVILATYFMTVIVVSVFTMNPIILVLSLFGAVSQYIVQNRILSESKTGNTHLLVLAIFPVAAILNPLFSHNGATILFVMNNNPITLEAFLYGISAATLIVSMLYRFSSFSQIMTSDRLLYLFGRMSPKTALLLSMALRYVPLFSFQAKKINQTQKALGLYKNDNFIDGIRGGIRVFSVMVTWALENGIVTADSMTARGYGSARRTSFALYHFGKRDVLMLVIILILLAATVIPAFMGALVVEFYPYIKIAETGVYTYSAYISYGILSIIPVIIETGEKIKWHFLKSKI